MSEKKKFRPQITRVKLNPEQAVLNCTCYSTGRQDGGGYTEDSENFCFISFSGTKFSSHFSQFWSFGSTQS